MKRQQLSQRDVGRKTGAGSTKTGKTALPIVGIGASEGGLEAFTQLLQNLPVDTGMAFVLVQHLDPEHESAREILGRATAMPVREVMDKMVVRPDHVYMIPPDKQLSMRRGQIQCHHYMKPSERINALRACREVLKPGGLFVTFENIAPRMPEGVRFGLAAWKHFLMDNGRTEQEADQHIARYGKELLPITAGEHLDALAQAGFGVVEIFWYSQMQAGFYAIK